MTRRRSKQGASIFLLLCVGPAMSDPIDPDVVAADEDEDDNDDDWDDEHFDSLYLKYLFEDAPSLAGLSAMLRSLADDFDQKAREGWRLNSPVSDGWAHLVKDVT